MNNLLKPLISGALVGSAMAVGMYAIYATPGDNPVLPRVLDQIIEPGQPDTAKNAESLGNIPSGDWQRNVNRGCTGRNWATGVDANNNIICKNW